MPWEKELVVVAADKSIKMAVAAVLARRRALRIRALEPSQYDLLEHVGRDSGVFQKGHELLRLYLKTHRHGLLLCDRHGCGREDASREALEQEMEERLRQSGWGNRAAAVVIDPELEVWVWTRSPHVEEVLGWKGRRPSLVEWMRNNGYLAEGEIKPQRPQECLDRALEIAKKPRSSALFGQIAKRVSLASCTDPAFRKLRSTLQSWFPP